MIPKVSRFFGIPGFVYCFLLAGCHSNDVTKSGPEDFYTVQVASDYQIDNFSWVMASDKNGEWIDAKQLFAGQSTILHGVVPADKTFTIHFLYTSPNSPNTDVTLLSYTEVPVKETWILKPPPVITHTGNPYDAFIQVTNFIDNPQNDNLRISTNDGLVLGYHTGNSTATYSEFDLEPYHIPANILLSYFRNNTPFVLLAPVTSEAQLITMDAAVDEKSMDTQFSFDYSADTKFHGYFYGYDAGDNPYGIGYIHSEFYTETGGGTVKLGYLNGYDQYKTLIVHDQASAQQTYYKLGSAITAAPSFTSLNVSVNNSNPLNYSASAANPFTVSTVTLRNTWESYFTWVINQPNSGSSGDIKLSLKAFPSDMTSLFPALDASVLKSEKISITQYLDGTTYSDLLNRKKNSVYNNTTEYITLSANQ